MSIDVVREIVCWFGKPEARATWSCYGQTDGVPKAVAKAIAKAAEPDRLQVFLDWAKQQSIGALSINGGLPARITSIINDLSPTRVTLDCVELDGILSGLRDDVVARFDELAVLNSDALDLAGLARCTGLEQLAIGHYEIDPAKLAVLSKALPSLVTLWLKSSSDLNLAKVSIPKSLTRLEIQVQGRLTLPKLPAALTSLSVEARRIDGVDAVGSATAIERLSLSQDDEAPVAKVALDKLAALQSLDLRGVTPKTKTWTGPLQKLNSLNVHFRNGSPPSFDLGVLGKLAALEELRLYQLPPKVDLAALAAMPRLRAVTLGDDYKPTLTQLQPLAGRDIELRDSPLGTMPLDEFIAHLKKPAKTAPRAKK